jgi:hypothetical protein
LDFLRILQLSNYSVIRDVQYPMSWRVDLRLDRPPMDDQEPGDDPLSVYGAIASGYAWDYWDNQRAVGFAMLGGRARLHPEYNYKSSVGPMFNSGLKIRALPWLSMLFTSEVVYSVLGERGFEIHHEGDLRIGGPSLEVRIAGSRWEDRNEGALRVLYYY